MKKAVAVAGLLVVGAIAWASSGPAKAASSGPKNVSTVGSKVGAIALGAQVTTGGTWVIVATDEAHRAAVLEVVRRRAAAQPQWRYVVIDLGLARQLAAERAEVTIPADIWGGVATIRGGELVKHVYFPTTDTIATAEERIVFAEKIAGLGGLGATPEAIASVAAGLLVHAPEVGSGPLPRPDVGSGPTPSPASLPPVGVRRRLLDRLRGR